jgi:16S rRNA (guanine527-N7)-methyltransferase
VVPPVSADTGTEDAAAPAVPDAPPEASVVFADRLPLAVHYAALLAGPGTVRGLIGPREVPRLWSRHLLNCAVVGELVPAGATVVDVGSGAGLPGLPLAIAWPDLDVVLVEPMARRVDFLREVVAELGLAGVEVVRGRAEDIVGQGSGDVVTSRAVAPLERLAPWCVPLTRPGGQVLAMKGSGAPDEVRAAGPMLRRLGVSGVSVVVAGAEVLAEPTTLVRFEVGDRPRPGGGRRRDERPGRRGR